jgi:adhesin HecA-like repeat protein
MSKPLALITGASSGIGADLARVYADNGYDLVVTARREERLQALAEELAGRAAVHVITADLAKAKGPAGLFAAVQDAGLEVETLVNNAGVLSGQPFVQAPRKAVTDLVNLNVRALTELTQLFLPAMLERGYGRILNVASVASFQPVPGLAVYGASKAFVLSLTESLSEELRGTGVTVTALCPGPTRTEMAEAFDGMDGIDMLMASSAAVAREGFEASQAGQVIRVPGLMNQAYVTWSRYQPRWLVRAISGFTARNSIMMRGES